MYPHLYLWTDQNAGLVRLSREINAHMPARMVQVAADASDGSLDGKHVLVLGVSYRGDVKEPTFSGVFHLVDLLQRHGASVTVSDPLFSDAELRDLELKPHPRGEHVDVVVVHTDHTAFRSLGAQDLLGATVIVDGRNVLDPALFPEQHVLALGRGTAASSARSASLEVQMRPGKARQRK